MNVSRVASAYCRKDARVACGGSESYEETIRTEVWAAAEAVRLAPARVDAHSVDDVRVAISNKDNGVYEFLSRPSVRMETRSFNRSTLCLHTGSSPTS